MSARAAPIAVAAALAAACHHAPTPAKPMPPVEINAAYLPTPLGYPAGKATDFTACNGVVLVCVNGGVALAGLDGWAVDPVANGLSSVACAGTHDGWGLRGVEVVRMPADNKSPWTVVAKLPAGRYQLVDTGAEEPIVWGQVDATQHWIVARVSGAKGVVMFEDARAIGAVAPAGHGALLVAVDKQLLRVDAKGAHPLSTLDSAPDGLAVGDDGAIFASLPGGVVRMTRESVKPVAIGMHGPLRIERDSIYFLLADRNAVMRLLRR